jgi:MSHA biogenesis protein MshL
MLRLFFTAVFFALVGCSTLDQPEKVKLSNTADFEFVKEQKKQRVATPFVVEMNRVYVRQISDKEARMPSWFLSKVSKSYDAVGLLAVVQDLFRGISVKIEFREGVKKGQLLRLKAKGTYGEALNTIKAITGYQWEYSDDTLVWSKYVTKIFQVHQLSGNVAYSVGRKGIRGSGGDGGGSQSSSQRNVVSGDVFSASSDEYSVISGEIDVLADVGVGVKAILGCSPKNQGEKVDGQVQLLHSSSPCAQGASAEILRSTSSIVVVGLPSQVEAVGQFIAQKNIELTRQVMIDISMISVEFNDNTQFAIDVDLVRTAFRNWGNFSLATTAGNGLIGGLDARGVLSLKYGNEGTDPSALFIEALEKQGSVSEKRYPRVVAINNRVGTVANIDRVNFIEDRTVSSIANIGTNLGIVQATAETGYTLHALPNIHNDSIVLHLSTSLSALLDLEKKGEGPGSRKSGHKRQNVQHNYPPGQWCGTDHCWAI